MAEPASSLRIPTPLPTTVQGHLDHRKLKVKRSLNDLVEDLHLKLVEDEDYLALIEAVYDSMAVEGNTDLDDAFAAKMIRDAAKKANIAELAGLKLDPIVHSLRVVLRRYGFSRKERRLTVSGVRVPEENGQPHQGEQHSESSN